jgi:hypothetical protein
MDHQSHSSPFGGACVNESPDGESRRAGMMIACVLAYMPHGAPACALNRRGATCADDFFQLMSDMGVEPHHAGSIRKMVKTVR